MCPPRSGSPRCLPGEGRAKAGTAGTTPRPGPAAAGFTCPSKRGGDPRLEKTLVEQTGQTVAKLFRGPVRRKVPYERWKEFDPRRVRELSPGSAAPRIRGTLPRIGSGGIAMEKRKDIWFPAKRCGWGWGVPCAWQGWVVLAVYVALVMAAAAWIPKDRTPLFAGIVILLTLVLVGICWAKGERPKWRR